MDVEQVKDELSRLAELYIDRGKCHTEDEIAAGTLVFARDTLLRIKNALEAAKEAEEENATRSGAGSVNYGETARASELKSLRETLAMCCELCAAALRGEYGSGVQPATLSSGPGAASASALLPGVRGSLASVFYDDELEDEAEDAPNLHSASTRAPPPQQHGGASLAAPSSVSDITATSSRAGRHSLAPPPLSSDAVAARPQSPGSPRDRAPHARRSAAYALDADHCFLYHSLWVRLRRARDDIKTLGRGGHAPPAAAAAATAAPPPFLPPVAAPAVPGVPEHTAPLVSEESLQAQRLLEAQLSAHMLRNMTPPPSPVAPLRLTGRSGTVVINGREVSASASAAPARLSTYSYPRAVRPLSADSAPKATGRLSRTEDEELRIAALQHSYLPPSMLPRPKPGDGHSSLAHAVEALQPPPAAASSAVRSALAVRRAEGVMGRVAESMRALRAESEALLAQRRSRAGGPLLKSQKRSGHLEPIAGALVPVLPPTASKAEGAELLADLIDTSTLEEGVRAGVEELQRSYADTTAATREGIEKLRREGALQHAALRGAMGLSSPEPLASSSGGGSGGNPQQQAAGYSASDPFVGGGGLVSVLGVPGAGESASTDARAAHRGSRSVIEVQKRSGVALQAARSADQSVGGGPGGDHSAGGEEAAVRRKSLIHGSVGTGFYSSRDGGGGGSGDSLSSGGGGTVVMDGADSECGEEEMAALVEEARRMTLWSATLTERRRGLVGTVDDKIDLARTSPYAYNASVHALVLEHYNKHREEQNGSSYLQRKPKTKGMGSSGGGGEEDECVNNTTVSSSSNSYQKTRRTSATAAASPQASGIYSTKSTGGGGTILDARAIAAAAEVWGGGAGAMNDSAHAERYVYRTLRPSARHYAAAHARELRVREEAGALTQQMAQDVARSLLGSGSTAKERAKSVILVSTAELAASVRARTQHFFSPAFAATAASTAQAFSVPAAAAARDGDNSKSADYNDDERPLALSGGAANSNGSSGARWMAQGMMETSMTSLSRELEDDYEPPPRLGDRSGLATDGVGRHRWGGDAGPATLEEAAATNQRAYIPTLGEIQRYCLDYECDMSFLPLPLLQNCLRLCVAVVTIQRVWRVHVARTERRRRRAAAAECVETFIRRDRAAMVLQRVLRIHVARRRLQAIQARISYFTELRVAYDARRFSLAAKPLRSNVDDVPQWATRPHIRRSFATSGAFSGTLPDTLSPTAPRTAGSSLNGSVSSGGGGGGGGGLGRTGSALRRIDSMGSTAGGGGGSSGRAAQQERRGSSARASAGFAAALMPWVSAFGVQLYDVPPQVHAGGTMHVLRYERIQRNCAARVIWRFLVRCWQEEEERYRNDVYTYAMYLTRHLTREEAFGTPAIAAAAGAAGAAARGGGFGDDSSYNSNAVDGGGDSSSAEASTLSTVPDSITAAAAAASGVSPFGSEDAAAVVGHRREGGRRSTRGSRVSSSSGGGGGNVDSSARIVRSAGVDLDRYTGDVYAKFLERTARERAQGNFFTPLQHVSLAELRAAKAAREAAELARLEALRRETEERLERDMVRQRRRQQAALTLQRTARGYRRRLWLSGVFQRAQERHRLNHRRAQLIQRVSAGDSVEGPEALLLIGSGGTVAADVLEGSGAVALGGVGGAPITVADLYILRAIGRRHPNWLRGAAPGGITARGGAAVVESVDVVQRFLRAYQSVEYGTLRFLHSRATVIQRAWRAHKGYAAPKPASPANGDAGSADEEGDGQWGETGELSVSVPVVPVVVRVDSATVQLGDCDPSEATTPEKEAVMVDQWAELSQSL